MTASIKKIPTWGLTWDRVGKPGKRTGNRFFSEAKAKQVFEQKKAAGLNPSPIAAENLDWICA
jgi:hypothetical protein